MHFLFFLKETWKFFLKIIGKWHVQFLILLYISHNYVSSFQVIVGSGLRYKIGYLKYASTTDVGTLSRQLIIGLSVGAVVLILILVVCLIVYRQKSNQNSRVLKSMQEQMDVLELRVAAECKEGM